eukprot:s1817_g1.t1
MVLRLAGRLFFAKLWVCRSPSNLWSLEPCPCRATFRRNRSRPPLLLVQLFAAAFVSKCVRTFPLRVAAPTEVLPTCASASASASAKSCQSKCHLCPHTVHLLLAPAALGPVALTEVLPSSASASASASAQVVPVYAAASPAHSACLGGCCPSRLAFGFFSWSFPFGFGCP